MDNYKFMAAALFFFALLANAEVNTIDNPFQGITVLKKSV